MGAASQGSTLCELAKLLKDQPNDADDDEWQDMQEQVVSIVMLYLHPQVI